MSIPHISKLLAFAFTCALTATAASAAGLSKADTDFVNKAAQSGTLEIQASQLAEQKSQSPEVKQFAQTMVTDHSKAAAELKTVAQSKGMQVPDGLSTDQQAKLTALGKLDGAAFDKRYAHEIGVSAHKEAVSLFEKASKHAKDPDIKAFASKTLPTLKGHLKMAETMNAHMKKAS